MCCLWCSLMIFVIDYKREVDGREVRFSYSINALHACYSLNLKY